MQQLSEVIRARYPVIWLSTFEEGRALEELREFCEGRDKELWSWSCVSGLQALIPEEVGERKVDEETLNPETAIGRFMATKNGGVLAMLDLHGWIEQNPPLIRLLRETAQALRLSYKTLVLVSPAVQVPDDLAKDILVLDYPLPDMEAMLSLVRVQVAAVRDTAKHNERVLALSATEEELARALMGLTLDEAASALGLSAVKAGAKDVPVKHVLDAKKAIIRQSGALEYLEPPDSDYFRGYELLREYLDRMALAFTPEAREFGVEYPKGLLLVSPPGCGKSLVTRLVGRLWSMPVIRLDLGAVFGSLVGQSEENVRRAIALAEAVSPAILQIDEIDKGFAGSKSSGQTDSGTSARVFGRFLTWMQEKTSPVVVLATSNNVTALPPELLRKGRFDELFMMDLPNEQERAAIFEAHIAKRGREPDWFDVDSLAGETEGFSGAEIEQVVKEALLTAFAQGQELTAEDLWAAINDTVPLSKTMAEEIQAMREWGWTRTRAASLPIKKRVGKRELAGIEL